MELQTQYQSPSFRLVGNTTTLPHHQLGNMFGAHQSLNVAVFSAQESELTSNMSGSRKRIRHQDDYQYPEDSRWHPLQISQSMVPSKMAKVGQISAKTFTPTISSGLPKSYEENPINALGRASACSQSSLASSFVKHSQDLDSSLFIQNLDIEALIQQHNEKLRSVLEETRNRHFRSLISVLRPQILKNLQEKERELADANSRNAQLEEKLMQMSAENQFWFNVAKNNEAMASSLKSSLEQIILFNQNQTQFTEGCGDTDEDAQSCCNPEVDNRAEDTIVEKERRICKVCHENDISVLVLPCRHLCLCTHCDFKIDTCPICNSPKNATLPLSKC